MKFKSTPAFIFLLLAACGPLPGAERDFQAIVGAIETHYGVRQTRIPLLGVAKFFVRAAGPEGARQLDLATFEDLEYDPAMLANFRDLVQNALGDAWHALVQVHAPGRREYTGIFVKASGGQFRMIVTALESREATVVELRLSPRGLFDRLRDPEKMGSRAGIHGADDCCDQQ